MEGSELNIKVPKLGEGIQSAEVTAILVKVGDRVEPEQALIEVESNKASLTIPSKLSGKVSKLCVKVGEEIEIGQLILVLSSNKNIDPPASKLVAQDTQKHNSTSKTMASPVGTNRDDLNNTDTSLIPELEIPDKARQSTQKANIVLVPAAPSIRCLARELGADITKVQGTGPRGRISIEDVKAHVKQRLSHHPKKDQSSRPRASTAPGPNHSHPPLPDFSRFGTVHREKMTKLRQSIADKMSIAWQQVPHVTQFDEADATTLEEFRVKRNKTLLAEETSLSLTAILLKITALALGKFPQFNTILDMQNHEIIYREYVHLGLAVDRPQGLVVIVIQNVDRKGLKAINKEMKALVQRSRENKPLEPQELEGSCLSLSNLGALGTTHFTPIVNWPETAVLGIGKAKYRGIANAQYAPLQARLILPLSLSYDHRVIDGAQAARFLRWIAETIEYPLDFLE